MVLNFILLHRKPYQVFGLAAVLVELRVEHDEVDAAEPEGEVVVAERRNVAGDRLRSWSVS